VITREKTSGESIDPVDRVDEGSNWGVNQRECKIDQRNLTPNILLHYARSDSDHLLKGEGPPPVVDSAHSKVAGQGRVPPQLFCAYGES